MSARVSREELIEGAQTVGVWGWSTAVEGKGGAVAWWLGCCGLMRLGSAEAWPRVVAEELSRLGRGDGGRE